MVTITFADRVAEKKALAFLLGRFLRSAIWGDAAAMLGGDRA